MKIRKKPKFLTQFIVLAFLSLAIAAVGGKYYVTAFAEEDLFQALQMKKFDQVRMEKNSP